MPSLRATSVATRITSDVGIVVERAMYWPFDPGAWQEAHNAFGVTATGRRWGLAEGRVGGSAGFQTFVLLANPDAAAATVTATFLRTTGVPVVKTSVVQPGARLTVTTGPASMVPELADESFGTVVASDQPLFAERALYAHANNGFWAAGSAATATAILWPPVGSAELDRIGAARGLSPIVPAHRSGVTWRQSDPAVLASGKDGSVCWCSAAWPSPRPSTPPRRSG